MKLLQPKSGLIVTTAQDYEIGSFLTWHTSSAGRVMGLCMLASALVLLMLLLLLMMLQLLLLLLLLLDCQQSFLNFFRA